MPAPEILAFGAGAHDAGATGLTIDGGGFGAFPGSAWIYENSDRTGDADELTIGAWNDIELSGVEIPGSPNNGAGTRYLFVQREDLAWSQGFQFTLAVGLTLEVADCVHAHSAATPTLTQAHLLAVADALHGHTVENIDITQAGELAVADALHSHSADSIVLTQAHTLVVSDALHPHTADNVELVIPGPAYHPRRVFSAPSRTRVFRVIG